MSFLDSVMASDAAGWALPGMKHDRTLGAHADACLAQMRQMLRDVQRGAKLPMRHGHHVVLTGTTRRLTKQYVKQEYKLHPY